MEREWQDGKKAPEEGKGKERKRGLKGKRRKGRDDKGGYEREGKKQEPAADLLIRLLLETTSFK